MLDYKPYNFASQPWGIGVAETWYSDDLLKRKDELIQEMAMEKIRSNLVGFIFCIIDLISEINYTLIVSEYEETIVEETFNATTVDGVANLGPRISRKLQIIPPLEAHFNTIFLKRELRIQQTD